MTTPEPHARLDLSPIRRWTAILIVAGVGAICLYLAGTNPTGAISAALVMLLIGCAFFWVAAYIHRKTQHAILLTDDGLVLEDGTPLARLGEMEAVDRSIMAFKPSNGFAVKLRTRGQFGWSPGVWWRLGRNLGIGGATSRDQARHMADTLSAMLQENSVNR